MWIPVLALFTPTVVAEKTTVRPPVYESKLTTVGKGCNAYLFVRRDGDTVHIVVASRIASTGVLVVDIAKTTM